MSCGEPQHFPGVLQRFASATNRRFLQTHYDDHHLKMHLFSDRIGIRVSCFPREHRYG